MLYSKLIGHTIKITDIDDVEESSLVGSKGIVTNVTICDFDGNVRIDGTWGGKRKRICSR